MWMIAIEILEVEQMLISWTCGTTVEHGAKYIDAHRWDEYHISCAYLYVLAARTKKRLHVHVVHWTFDDLSQHESFDRHWNWTQSQMFRVGVVVSKESENLGNRWSLRHGTEWILVLLLSKYVVDCRRHLVFRLGTCCSLVGQLFLIGLMEAWAEMRLDLISILVNVSSW